MQWKRFNDVKDLPNDGSVFIICDKEDDHHDTEYEMLEFSKYSGKLVEHSSGDDFSVAELEEFSHYLILKEPK